MDCSFTFKHKTGDKPPFFDNVLFYNYYSAVLNGDLHAVLNVIKELIAKAIYDGHRNAVAPNVGKDRACRRK